MSRRLSKINLERHLFVIQRGRCSICGARIERHAENTIDHVVPRTRGGFERGNKLLAHAACNFQKGDALPTGCEMIMLAAANAAMFSDGERRLIEIQLAAAIRGF